MRFVLSLVLLIAACGSLGLHPGLRIERQLHYLEPSDDTHEADLYLPAGPGPYPVVITVHGGTWEGRRRQDMGSIARKLAIEGFVVMNINYRQSPRDSLSTAAEDFVSAVAWLEKNQSRYNLDLARLSTWGYSIGAEVAFQGVMKIQGRRPFRALVDGAGAIDSAAVTDGTPPTFIYHSSNDHVVPFEKALAFQRALQNHHVEVRLERVPLLGHYLTFMLSASSIQDGIDFLKAKSASAAR